MTTRCLIVDDEPLAIKVISSYIGRVPNLTEAASCNSGFEALEVLQNQDIDVVFLDIQMPGLTGLDMIKSLKNPPSFIFTTAHRDFAVDAYDLNAVDYLLKPISFPRFLQSVNKFLEIKRSSSLNKPEGAEKNIVFLRANRRNYNVDVSTILFVEGLKDYVKVHLENGKLLITKEKMSDMEEKLDEYGFIRIHKSFLVQKHKISSYKTESLDINEIEIPIGRTYREKVLEELGK